MAPFMAMGANNALNKLRDHVEAGVSKTPVTKVRDGLMGRMKKKTLFFFQIFGVLVFLVFGHNMLPKAHFECV